jgi:hypothetical protein
MAAIQPSPGGESEVSQNEPRTFKLNKETIGEVLGGPLPGINDVQIVVMRVQSLNQRVIEQLSLNIVGSLMAAAIAFFVGLYVGRGDTAKTTTPPFLETTPEK